MAGSVIAFSSRRQHNIALSTAEAELYALTEAAKEIVYLRVLIEGLGKELVPWKLFCDNQSAIAISTQPEQYRSRIKHISAKDMYIKEVISNGQIELEWVTSGDNVADILTKPLPFPAFCKHRQNLGVMARPEGGTIES